MRFKLHENYNTYIAIIHIDDEDGSWVYIKGPNPEAAVDYILEKQREAHPEAKWIRVSIDDVSREWGNRDDVFVEDIETPEEADDNVSVQDEIETPEQKYSSAKTSINSSKLPAIFSLVKFEPNTINLDFGGGKFDNATEALAQKDVTNLIYDPFNRTREHNTNVISTIRQNGGADTVTCSNVLNVIAEEEVRLSVLTNIKKLLRRGGVAYFTVYEGNGEGVGKETSAGYQLNRKTADYLPEISTVFPSASKKGKLIIARL